MPAGVIVHNVEDPLQGTDRGALWGVVPQGAGPRCGTTRHPHGLAVMAPTEAEAYSGAYTMGMSAELMTLDNMPHGKNSSGCAPPSC